MLILSIISGKSLGGEEDSHLRVILISRIKRLHGQVGRELAAALRQGQDAGDSGLCGNREQGGASLAQRTELPPADRVTRDKQPLLLPSLSFLIFKVEGLDPRIPEISTCAAGGMHTDSFCVSHVTDLNHVESERK